MSHEINVWLRSPEPISELIASGDKIRYFHIKDLKQEYVSIVKAGTTDVIGCMDGERIAIIPIYINGKDYDPIVLAIDRARALIKELENKCV